MSPLKIHVISFSSGYSRSQMPFVGPDGLDEAVARKKSETTELGRGEEVWTLCDGLDDRFAGSVESVVPINGEEVWRAFCVSEETEHESAEFVERRGKAGVWFWGR
jgi:hypothetical protein